MTGSTDGIFLVVEDDSSNDVISQRPQLQPPKRSTAKPPLAS